jgi:hypothetical protein
VSRQTGNQHISKNYQYFRHTSFAIVPGNKTVVHNLINVPTYLPTYKIYNERVRSMVNVRVAFDKFPFRTSPMKPAVLTEVFVDLLSHYNELPG